MVNTSAKIEGAQLENRIDTSVRETVAQPQYADVSVESVRVQRDHSDITHPPERAVVVIGIPPGTSYPGLSTAVADAITRQTDRDIDVRVEYVYVDEPV